MKVGLVGVAGVPLGKHKVKDPRLDQADKLVEIIGYEDFVAAGGETQAKHANKMRVETKSYVMQDYDLANFRFKK
jgi:ribosome-binding ATPase YchF (GTP1/OBG family)